MYYVPEDYQTHFLLQTKEGIIILITDAIEKNCISYLQL